MKSINNLIYFSYSTHLSIIHKLILCCIRITVLGRRKIEGCLCRVPAHFYNHVWEVLMRCPDGICVNGRELPQQPTLSNMTRSELTFALFVESLLHHIQLPEYRQIIVEVFFFYLYLIYFSIYARALLYSRKNMQYV